MSFELSLYEISNKVKMPDKIKLLLKLYDKVSKAADTEHDLWVGYLGSQGNKKDPDTMIDYRNRYIQAGNVTKERVKTFFEYLETL
jgi:hypothetical protein